MKQIQFDKLGGPEVLKLVDAPTPEAVKGTVLIRNRAIGINFADTLFRQGQYAQAPVLPDTPGLEAAGTIEKVGEGVSGFSVGMRVAGIGAKAYSEYMVARASQVIPIPDHVSFDEGAA